MIGDSIRAILFGGVPVAAFTFLVLQWSIASGRLSRFDDSKGLEKQFKAHKKANAEAKATAKAEKKKQKIDHKLAKLDEMLGSSGSEESAQSIDPTTSKSPKKPLFHKDAGTDFVHNKVMFFGGGFYGMMALFAYFVIEVGEIFGFLGVVFTPGAWFENLGFDLIVGFIINSFVNIGLAFAWFIPLQDYVTIGNGWIWLAAAYGGYIVGLKLVSQKGDQLWAQLGVGARKGAAAVGENFEKLRTSNSTNKDDK